MSDEDVVIACYARKPYVGGDALWDLRAIAVDRKSRFLLFVSSIYQHLNDENVAILAKKESAMFEASEPEPANAESSQPEKPSSSEAAMERDEYGEPHGTPKDTPEAKAKLSELKSPSSSEAEFTSSSDDVSMDSDFEEEVGGIFFGETSWCCENCNFSIVDGVCPNGHDLPRCMACNWQLVDGSCPSCQEMCEGCGMGKEEGECPGCASGGVEDSIVFDITDGIWKCVYCQWEVEADNGTDDNCHCLKPKGEARYLDLPECLDYEPADSDSSHDNSSADEEPDSGDEGSIDDETVAVEGAFDSVTETITLARIAAVSGDSPIKIAAEAAKAMLAAEDKENMEPDASLGVEIVDGPDVGSSNIVDIESMNM